MADLTIANAATLTGAGTATGDLFPLVDVSATAGSQGSKITRDELRIAMGITGGGTIATGGFTLTVPATGTAALTNFAQTISAKQTFNQNAANILSFSAGMNTPAIGISNGNLGFGFYDGGAGWMQFLQNPDAISIATSCRLGWGTTTVTAFFAYSAAATIQMGANHATTATAQTFKAHSVTTGTGASLTIAGGTGSVAGGEVILATSATTGAPTARLTVAADGLITVAGQLKLANANTTGAGSALLGTNSPAATLTAPYTWETVKSSDGSTCYMPLWK